MKTYDLIEAARLPQRKPTTADRAGPMRGLSAARFWHTTPLDTDV